MALPTVLRRTALGMGGVVFALQLVPYGWRHSNPPVTAPVTWSGPEPEALARGACYDCHSNETEWPPYSYVAPMSWLVRRDVEAGREELNFSTWDADDDGSDAAEAIAEGSMPPRQYTLLHSGARLSEHEKRVLIADLEAMDDGDRSGPGGGEED